MFAFLQSCSWGGIKVHVCILEQMIASLLKYVFLGVKMVFIFSTCGSFASSQSKCKDVMVQTFTTSGPYTQQYICGALSNQTANSLK